MPERREGRNIDERSKFLRYVYTGSKEGYTLTFFHYQWFLRKRQNSVGQINSLPWPREPSAHGKKLVPQGAVASKILLSSARHERLNEPKTTLETDHYAVRVPLPDFDPPILASNPGGVSIFAPDYNRA